MNSISIKFFVIFSVTVFAVSYQAKSFVIQKNSSDSLSAKIDQIQKMVVNFPDSALKEIEKIRLREENAHSAIEIRLLKLEGTAAAYTRRIDLSISKFVEARDRTSELILEYQNKGDTLNNLEYFDRLVDFSNFTNNVGALNFMQKNHKEAIIYLTEASEVQRKLQKAPFEDIADKAKQDLAGTTDNIANIYSSLGMLEKCLEYRLKAYSMLAGMEASNTRFGLLFNISKLYQKLGVLDSAIYYAQEILNGADSIEYSGYYYSAWSLRADYYLDQNKIDSAGIALQKVSNFPSFDGNYIWKERHILTMSRYYAAIGEYQKAFDHLENAQSFLEESKDVTGVFIYKLKSEIYFGLGREQGEVKYYELAAEFLQSAFSLADSLHKVDQSKEVNELQTKYETEKKDQMLKLQNAQLKQQTTQRNALLAGIGLLGIISLLIFRSQRIKSKTNQQLKEAEALKNRWLANVSHELKTPLTLVQAPLTKVLDSTKLNEIDRGNLKVANRSVKQLKRLVSEILDLTKLDKGHLELHPAITDYADLVRVTSYAFESLAISRGTQLRVQTEASCWMYIDEHQIRKTIENLLTNALKFTKEDDTITVGLTVENEAVQLTVTDTGMGISEEDLTHIFDRFYQAQDPAKSRIGGTGIGLSLTKEIIELHEGAIMVGSQEGRETTFTISLPTSLLREAPEEKASPKENTNESHSVPDSGYQEIITELPRLLLVEDNDDMRNFLINDLKTDYTITKALDGKDALDKLSGTTYDVIISDIMMPRMDGMTLIQEVKKNPDWKKIPLIVLTALDGEEDRLSVLRTGVDDYITKPFNSEELKVRLQNLINNSKSRSDAEGIEEEEDSLLASIEKDIKMHLADLDYTVKAMADNVSMTERSLHRYLKKTTGLSPTGLITELKLQKAMQLLEKKSFRTLKEICSEVGYERTSRFSTAFEKRFGKRPADYL